uniref:protein acetyllysine N-acetyltransferase n=1 Tax=Danio rerio TaxID=7955 RepID=E7F8W3_DANRE|nr:NAD-dependent protein deacetylase sirtuin-1 isoform X1 [Danio rerio]|eukprot:XP_001334440.4 NAD-dependent protein deacetylase sirtuin-1 isoform X1 [Danio rerio]
MADGENKRAESAEPDEPLPKKPRLLELSGDSEHSATAGADTLDEKPARMDESQQALSINNNNNTRPTEPGQPADPEPEISELTDEGVHPNGFTSPDLLRDDDDCSSRASSSDWTPQPQIGSYRFIQQHIMRGTDPRAILKDLLPETVLPPDLDDMTLWQIIINISEPPKRKKRKDINTLEDVVRLLNERKKILVLTGAGVSVSCGIPDFRSRDGIYARLAVDFPDLPDPQAMFDIDYFRRDPRPFFKFAKEIYPGQFQPSPCHRFISMLDKKGRLLRNYTQNIDTLEQVAGIQKIIQCHGSFATASCLICKHKVDCEAIREDIFNQVVPHCPRCPSDVPYAIMKPDIVFFGENLPEFFHRAMKQDKDEVDLLIVIGSSLKVRPVALIPSSIPHDVPQVLINREPLPHLNFDVELLGDCDVIVNELCHRLNGDFQQLCYNSSRLSEITEKPAAPEHTENTSADHSHADAEHIENTSADHSHADAEHIENTSADRDDAKHTENTPTDHADAEHTKNTSADHANAEHTENTSAGHVNAEHIEHMSKDHANPKDDQSSLSVNEEELASPAAETHALDSTEISAHTERSKEADAVNTDDAACVKDEENTDRLRVEMRRRCWRSRICQSPISKRLGASQYLFQAPNRYVFHGAEVYSSSEDESSSSCGSESDGSFQHEDSEVEENGAAMTDKETDTETVQDSEHRRLQTHCTQHTQ